MEAAKSLNVNQLKANRPSENRLYDFLKTIDEYFIPNISSQTDLEGYSKKLISKANVFLVSINHIDVGILAIYLNDYNLKSAFITSIGVLPEYRKYGIGQYLLDLAKEQTVKAGFKSIHLEVSYHNIRAIRFYEKNKFISNQAFPDKGTIQMTLEI